MRREDGVLTIFHQDGRIDQRDTVTCRHCQAIVECKPGTAARVYLIPDEQSPGGIREEAGAYCSSCGGPTCLRAACLVSCEHGSQHFMRKIERAESRGRMMRAVFG